MSGLKKPNILFICTDQQRWDTLGVYKPKKLHVSNLDRLLEQGIHLPNTFCQSPVCIPARACMLAGQYPTQTGLYHNTGILPDDKITWPSVFASQGYETIAVGRAHGIIAGFSCYVPIPFGDSFFNMSADVNEPEVKWTYAHHYYKQLPHIYEGDFENYMDVRCANTACHVLRDLKDTHKPWAMYIGILAPHNPYIIPKKYAEYYQQEDFDLPVWFEEDFQKPNYVSMGGGSARQYWEQFSEDDIRHTRRMYYSMVTMVDELLGRILDQLDVLGLTDNTIVLLTTDHGEMSGDHARWAKLNFYEAAVRIPCIVSYPTMFEGGKVLDAMVEQVDFMPTLLDLAGLGIPSSVAGRSFTGVLEGRTLEHKDRIYSAFHQSDQRLRCLRSQEHSFSYGYKTEHGVTGELYDLKVDPQERHNLYDDESHRRVRDDYLRQLLDFEIEHGYVLHEDRPYLTYDRPMSLHLR